MWKIYLYFAIKILKTFVASRDLDNNYLISVLVSHGFSQTIATTIVWYLGEQGGENAALAQVHPLVSPPGVMGSNSGSSSTVPTVK